MTVQMVDNQIAVSIQNTHKLTDFPSYILIVNFEVKIGVASIEKNKNIKNSSLCSVCERECVLNLKEECKQWIK